MSFATISAQGINRVLGDGTAGNPYQIRTATQLAALAKAVNNWANQADIYYVQTADLDLTQYAPWVPIGLSTGRPFSGYYNGNGYTIRGLNLTGASETYCGLFGYVTTADATNPALSNIGVLSAGGAGIEMYIGGSICGNLSGIMSGCWNLAPIRGNSNTGTCRLGGLCGAFGGNGTIQDCWNGGAITQNSTNATRNTGGILGFRAAGTTSINRCLNSGAITGNGTLKAISGNSGSTLTNCYYDSTTSGASDGTGTTALATENCQGADALTDVNKLASLSTTYWFATAGYPLPIRFQK